MFSKYNRVFWLSVVMTVFVFAPFYVIGFSTDVWARLIRIREWADAGFPFKEQLTYMQNYPFGLEMHWTRPLDWIGYVFAWPFIPNWGIKNALEIMAWFVPILTMIIAIRGFFFGVKGYLTPKMAFVSFWLFAYGIGYSWGQATVGYFDHHVFHFALLVWAVGLIARSFRLKDNRYYLILAGLLTGVGTWITSEFFINSYLLTIPFVIYWLFYNKSLKPAIIYQATYTGVLLAAISFDHPMAGFWTLDFYRVSLMHVILGALNVVALMSLDGLFRKVRSTVCRRFIYGVLALIIMAIILIIGFKDVLFVPMVDPVMYFIWTKRVGEMRPLYDNWADIVVYSVLPILVASGMLIWALFRLRQREVPLVLISAVGTLFYGVMIIFHIRTGVSLNAFFIYVAACYLNLAFFPREQGRTAVFFVLFYLLFIGTFVKGTPILNRFKEWGIKHYLELYKKDNTITVPDYLKEAFDKAVKEAENEDDNQADKKNITQNTNNEASFSCNSHQKIWDVIKNDKSDGALFADIFSAPELGWETGKPTFGGPYHTNVEGLTDLFRIQADRPPYDTAKTLLKKHKVSLLYLFHPKCQSVLFNIPEIKDKPDTETMFHYAVYNETPYTPKWLKLEYDDPKTHIKIFRMLDVE